MLKVFGREKMTSLDVQIERVISKMDELPVDDEGYPELISKLERLHKMKEKPNRVSRDTIVNNVGNFLGILLIVGFERTHVMTSKGFNFIRPRNQ